MKVRITIVITAPQNTARSPRCTVFYPPGFLGSSGMNLEIEWLVVWGIGICTGAHNLILSELLLSVV